MNAKKILSLFAVALFITMLISSCKSHEKCPGVGQLESETTQTTLG